MKLTWQNWEPADCVKWAEKLFLLNILSTSQLDCKPVVYTSDFFGDRKIKRDIAGMALVLNLRIKDEPPVPIIIEKLSSIQRFQVDYYNVNCTAKCEVGPFLEGFLSEVLLYLPMGSVL